ncbi:MAG: FtsW/RodA/SpoVE family cell cycle protein [Mesonia hippocampi]|uniref:FtsW/RodA/SpoVE family cell cycle protein n=1 Tax=Mesonia hippocampi TaxID=1628250 RepID=UPI003F9768ED
MLGIKDIKKRGIFNYLKGDKALWGVIALLAIFSFIPVYSSSSNIAYLYGDGGTFKFLITHFMHLFLGFVIIAVIHRVPYRYFRGLSIIAMPIVFLLLILTIAQGTTIDGANASRWIKIPFINKTIQTSTVAGVVLMVFVARYLSKIQHKNITFKESFIWLWAPVGAVLICILPANFSTTAIIFAMVMLLVFIGGYPIKYIGAMCLAGIVVLSIFILTAKAFPGLLPNRVDTWISRVESFADSEATEADYQIEKAKTAIATGGITGIGVGKSVQRNFLPQSSSDFIFAIIVEEMGLIGGIIVLLAYLFILFRIIVIATKATTVFGKLLVIGVGLPIIFQAFINIGVAVEVFPVTGQTLPLISSGGTSIWMTCVAFGIILSVSVKQEDEEVKLNEEEEVEDSENPLDVLSEAL